MHDFPTANMAQLPSILTARAHHPEVPPRPRAAGRPRQGTRMGHAHTTAIAGRIRQARLLRGLSQGDLARRIGLTFQQVQKYESAANSVTAGGLVEIARVLDLPVSFFLEDCGEPRVTADLPPEGCIRAAVTLARLPAMIRDRIAWLIEGLAAATPAADDRPAPAAGE